LWERFLAQLTCFRLTRHQAIAHSQYDAPSYAYNARMVVRTQGATFEGEPAVQSRVAAALAAADESEKVEQSQTPAAIVVEALLALCHQKKQTAQMDEVAKVVNAIFDGRYAEIKLSPEQVGIIVHRKLALLARRKGPGRFLDFDHATCAHIHRLAAEHHVRTLLAPPTINCPLCRQLVAARKKDGSDEPLSGSYIGSHAANNLRILHNLHLAPDPGVGFTEVPRSTNVGSDPTPRRGEQ
jgi:hypothetical protein